MSELKSAENFTGRYLCFTLGNEKFAIPLLQVKEVIADTKTTNIPQAPAYFRGIMNLRGQIISVIDLRNKLKVGKSEESTETTIVILDIDGLFIGVTVDSVDSVTSFEAASISEPPTHDSSIKIEYIMGVARKDKGLTLLIYLKKVLNTDDMKSIQQQQNKMKTA